MISLTVIISQYSPRTYEFETDNFIEALHMLADKYRDWEGTRNHTPVAGDTVVIEIKEVSE